MKNFTEVIIRPLLTEKSNVLSELQNKYVFQVFKNANKIDIKRSIENRFEVKVKKVSTINCKGKNKNMSVRSNGRVIRTNGNRTDWKKAIITLSGDDKIDLINGDFS
ncbi:MAG: 50S ribosomal protein L23 [Candidatus Marinimicrobia bacterium]|nr:50S ribosomal protein L23 [Candidatus Neomarinimicrobiota bacterium]MAV89658.1 50S ribosomal protein L23 [Candidatus Neomarinimicrobiota bacterium]MBV67625.1 50S ribosomal protein L23 [Candidatus Neomarinimicrobiota bacterium]|tara:strand:- start:83 stop:403 length:321 start_codon:yes stop_codon:yes gene_type:complete